MPIQFRTQSNTAKKILYTIAFSASFFSSFGLALADEVELPKQATYSANATLFGCSGSNDLHDNSDSTSCYNNGALQITYDLGANYAVTHSRMKFQSTNYPTDLGIYTSTDNSTYSWQATSTGSATTDVIFDQVNARYVRFNLTTSGSGTNYINDGFIFGNTIVNNTALENISIDRTSLDGIYLFLSFFVLISTYLILNTFTKK